MIEQRFTLRHKTRRKDSLYAMNDGAEMHCASQNLAQKFPQERRFAYAINDGEEIHSAP
jgi:cell wall assembly regulator SMI1